MGVDGEWEERLGLFLEVIRKLASASSRDAVARTIVAAGISALGAAYGGIWLVDVERRNLQLVATSPLAQNTIERWRTLPIERVAPAPESVRTETPIFIDSLADYAARFPDSFERIRETVGSVDASYAMLPLATDGAPFGVLAITYDHANALAPVERTLLLIVGRLCALALQRIELCEAARTARLEIEDAIRARGEMLAVVSQDLRGPLGTILMGATMLQERAGGDDPAGDPVATIATRIRRQAEWTERLLQDLVDFAGLDAGLAIERRPTQPAWIVTTATDYYTTVARERGIGFDVELPAPLPVIDVDGARGVQVVSNLLANAFKVTTQGGRVGAGVIDGAEIVFFVRDTGPGLEAQELPRVFERHWRSTKATYKGVGLGLSIARGIVDAHGGRIWAESQVGVGATFYFTLTPRARA